MHPIIGISGRIGTGKDTVVNLILDKYQSYLHLKFATNLKLIVSILTSTTLDENHTREGKASVPKGFDKSLGTYQQLLGEALRQLIGTDVWVMPIINHPAKYKVISDVRYPNEADAIQKAGGIVIRLERSELSRLSTLLGDTRNLEHESETALDNYFFKYRIINDGSLEDLGVELFRILDSYLG